MWCYQKRVNNFKYDFQGLNTHKTYDLFIINLINIFLGIVQYDIIQSDLTLTNYLKYHYLIFFSGILIFYWLFFLLYE